MTGAAPSSVQRVRDALAAAGIKAQVRELPQSTRTAAEAAAAVGCEVAQIAKSLVFRRADDGKPLLVIASGRNRVDEALVARHLGTRIGKADADFVRASTGFAIGGVPPLGHAAPIQTLIDEDLLAYDTIWAAAGTPNAVFPLAPQDLLKATGARVLAVRLAAAR